MPDMSEHNQPVPPVEGTVVPRYAGFSTFARLPRITDVPAYDHAELTGIAAAYLAYEFLALLARARCRA